MKNTLTSLSPQTGYHIGTSTALNRRSLANLLAPLDRMANDSSSLVVNRALTLTVAGESYFLPRYDWIGPRSGDAPIRVGIFGAIHGDEPEGAYALVRFLQYLERYPDASAGYALSIYPVCNPTGYEDNTRHSRLGKDLNREFWRKSKQPEVNLLQAELLAQSFHGLISLHTDDTCDGFYGIASGATLTKNLLEPALRAASEFLPLDHRAQIDGFPATNAIIEELYDGILSGPPSARPRPFEIVLETPKHQPTYLTESAFVAGLKTILTEYRKFIAYARNL